MLTKFIKTTLSCACLFLAGCKVELVVPEGGRVESTQGSYDCQSATTCSFDIDDDEFEETFTAIPNTGYRFAGWSSSESNVCEGEAGPCTLSLRGVPPTLRRSALASDAVARLTPVFEPQLNLTLSGSLGVLSNGFMDSDTNNPANDYRNNDNLSQAQSVPNPTTIGGYLNDRGVGETGNTYELGDFDDYFRLEARGGEVITLFTAEPQVGDLDLYLFNASGEIVDFSAGTGEIEQLVIPASGTWYLNPYLYTGASSYVLTVGVGGAVSTQGDPLPGEVLVEYTGEVVLQPQVSEARRRRVRTNYALEEKGGDVGRTRRLKLRIGGPTTAELLSPRIQAKAAHFGQQDKVRSQWATILLAKAISHEPGVAMATPNYRISTRAITNDPLSDYLWHYELINTPAAWDITVGDPSVVVAVVDSGIIPQHPDMNGQLLQGYDFIANPNEAGDGDGLDPDPTDEGEGSNAFRSGSYHGLHVAGTIAAAGNNNRGIAGVAYGSRIMPLRALGADGAGSSYDIQQAIRYAAGLSNDSGTVPSETADVINLSIGGGIYIQSEQNLFTTLADRGVLVAAASGNAGANRVEYPAAYDHVFAVGATDGQGAVSSYSNTGSALDLVAPGGEMEADINGDGYPDGVLSTYYAEGLPEYVFLQGTSMATPHVAGVFALMKSVNPALNSRDIERLLRAGGMTSDLGETGRDNLYGWGLIDARKAVATALDAAGGVSNLPPQIGVSSNSINLGSSLGSVDVIVSNLGDGLLTVTSVRSSADWLSAKALNTDENGLGTWQISAERAELSPGTYSANIIFESNAGEVSIQVTLRISDGASGDIGTVYVLFIDHDSQEVISQAVTRADQSYQFSQPGLPAGRYEIWAGTDNDNDFFICDEGETCGAFQTMDAPVIVEVQTDLADINFSSDYQISLRTITSQASAQAVKTSNGVERPPLKRMQ